MSVSEVEGCNRRGRLLGRWVDKVKEYMCERVACRRGGLEQARRKCMDKERCWLFCRGRSLGGHSRRERGIRENRMDRQIQANLATMYTY